MTMTRIVLPEPTALMEAFGIATDGVAPRLLDLRGHDGTRFAIDYRLLETATYDPAGRITLRFRGHAATILGRNLQSVYDALLHHRITFLQEQDFDAVPESEPFIESIRVQHADQEA